MGSAVPTEVTVTATWPTDDDLPVHFANHFLVQHDTTTHEFFVSIGSVIPPSLVGSPADLQMISDLQKSGTIPVKPVARIGLSPKRLLELVEVLQTNYRNYQANLAQEAARQEEQEQNE